jgi:hypothetical protein
MTGEASLLVGITSALVSALAYAAQGYPVLPCHGIINGYCTCGGRPNCKPGKHPLTPHGFKDATTDPAVITAWWEAHPYANVAIVTGGDIFVVETDPRHDGDKTLATLIAQHGELPPTLMCRSGGGGEHRYFRNPDGMVIKSIANVAQWIDVRGIAGYVLAPPSTHISGTRYVWLMPFPNTPLADAPDWLLALVSETPTPVAQTGALTLTMGSAEPCDLASHPGVGEGKRNDTLCRLLGVHLSRGDSPATIKALALGWAQRCDPPIAESRVLETLRWAERKRDENGSSVCAVRTNEPTAATSEVDDPEYVRSLADAFIPPAQPPTLSSPDTDIVADENGVIYDAGLTLHTDAYHGLAG